MNKKTLLGAVLALGYGTGAHAILINGTEVGDVDLLLCSADSPNSGQSYEEQLATGCAGQSVSLAENIDIDDSGLLSQAIAEVIYNAINVSGSEPGYFLLKFGTGNTGDDMLVFENVGSLSYLVWSDSQLLEAGIPSNHLDSISHYTFGGTPTTSVPEPSTLALLGLGILGLGAMRHRRAVPNRRAVPAAG
jgi:hypothetical protein